MENSAEIAGDEIVTGTVVNPLQTSAVRWINGTYTSCSNRTGSWSARVAGVDPMDNAQLTVVKNDPSCVLAITSLVADQTYAAAPAITLGTSYASSPSTFGTGSTAFPANARLESSNFANDFQITFIYGSTDPPAVGNSTVSGGYATVSSSVAITVVAASSYTMDVTGIHDTADPINLLVGINGQAVMTNGAVTGDSYVIDMGTLSALATYSQVASAYSAAISTQKSIAGVTNPTIQASEFNVLTLSLLGSTQYRTVIVKRTVGGIAAYQLFRVTFVS